MQQLNVTDIAYGKIIIIIKTTICDRKTRKKGRAPTLQRNKPFKASPLSFP